MIKNLSVTTNHSIVKKAAVHKLVKSLRNELNFEIDSLIVNFIKSDQIHMINKKYLKHDYSTDIITFNYSGSNSILDGEIFISYQDAQNNAKKYEVSLNEELKRLVIHGILHLIGYDDTKESAKKIMSTMENQLTNKYNFALL